MNFYELKTDIKTIKNDNNISWITINFYELSINFYQLASYGLIGYVIGIDRFICWLKY